MLRSLIRGRISRIAVTSAISGTIFWYASDPSKPCTSSDPISVIQKLNTNVDVKNSIDCLEKLYESDQLQDDLTSRISPSSWCYLAYNGSRICSQMSKPPKQNVLYKNVEPLIVQVIKDFDLIQSGSRLKKVKRFLSSIHDYTRKEVYERKQDSEYSFFYKMEYLDDFLSELVNKSEILTKPTREHVPKFLKWVYEEFPTSSHRRISVLKILANLTYSGHLSVGLMIDTGWMPLLAETISNPKFPDEPVICQKICVNLLYSLGACREKLPPNLYELHRPPWGVEPCLDIVFIHGIRGSAFRTWREKDKLMKNTTLFWPKDWLAEDIDNPIRILFIDYKSNVYQLRFGQAMETIEERSKNFQSTCTIAGIGERPMLFIVHSMGGLIAKRVLIENKELLKKTVGVLFMATPHKGTPIASHFVYKVVQASEDMKMLHIESELNKQLHSDFMHISSKIPLICSIVETKETPILFKRYPMYQFLTPEISGYPDIGSLYHIDEHHFNVCKPDNKNSMSYRVIYNFVKDGIHCLEVY